jgi:hypothetical protein
MEFKEGQYKGLQEVARRLNDYTKHAWNKDDEAFNLIVQVLSILNDDLCIISCILELIFILYISCYVHFYSCLHTTYTFPIYMIRCIKNMKKGVLHLSKKDQEKWEEYASRHGVVVKKDVWRDRARMTINWLRPFLGLTLDDYKILCKKCVAKVNGV